MCHPIISGVQLSRETRDSWEQYTSVDSGSTGTSTYRSVHCHRTKAEGTPLNKVSSSFPQKCSLRWLKCGIIYWTQSILNVMTEKIQQR